MMSVVQSNCPLIVINHTYSDPSALFASKFKAIPGGEGIKYASHVMLQMTKLMIKSADTEFLTGNESDEEDKGLYKGNRIRAFCVKNRVVKPCYEATMFIDFNNGIAKYDGLIEDAINYGFIESVRGGYIVKSYSDKKVTYKTLVSSDEIWNTFIDKFNETSIQKMAYSGANKSILDEIEKQISDDSDSGVSDKDNGFYDEEPTVCLK